MTKRVWVAFLALCTLSASSWLLPPTPGDTRLLATTVAYTLLSGAALVALRFCSDVSSPAVSVPGGARFGVLRLKECLRVGIAAAGAIAGPALLLEQAHRLVGASTAAAMLSLAPVAAAVAWAAWRGEAVHARLVPGMLAVAGMLSLLPVAEPASTSAFGGLLLSLCAAVLLGVSIVFCKDSFGSLPIWKALLVAASSNAVLFWVAFAFRLGRDLHLVKLHSGGALLEILFQFATGALALWLLRSMPPVAYTTRYLWTPLLIAVEGYAVLRPTLSWRIVAGGVLITSGAALLMREGHHVPDEVLRLR